MVREDLRPRRILMSDQALATDYDGTLATEGKVKQTTITALKRFNKQNWQRWGQPFGKI